MPAQIYISFRSMDQNNFVKKMSNYIQKNMDDVEVTMGLGDLSASNVSDQIAQCAALLVFVGADWAGKWLTNRSDTDRMAIAAALKNNRPIIPILVDGAGLPTSDSLPGDLRGLASQRALVLTSNSASKIVPRVVSDLEEYITERPPVDNLSDDYDDLFGDDSMVDSIGDLLNDSPSDSGFDDPFGETSGQDDALRRSRSLYGLQDEMPNFFAVPLDALMYPVRNDPRWPTKMFLGGVALIIPVVGPVVLTGYNIRAARRVLAGDKNLPEWGAVNLTADLSRGCFMVIGSGIHLIVYAIVFAILGAIVGFLTEAFAPFAILGLFIGPIIGYIVVTGLLNATVRYIATESIMEFFNFPALIGEIRNFSRNVTFLLYIWIYTMISSLFVALAGPSALCLCGLPLLLSGPYFMLGYFVILANWAPTQSDYKDIRKALKS